MFRDPRGPKTNNVPYMPYQNMDPNDPAMFTYPYRHHKLPIIEWQVTTPATYQSPNLKESGRL
ncbi:hypothetical protein DXG01_006955, partial [Tephrocybe rancida]